MKKSLSAIVLGSALSLGGCVVEKDLREAYLNSENVSGKIVGVDEDSIFDNIKKYPMFFEVLMVKTAQGIKKVLILHPTSYTDGDSFSESCKKIESGIVRFSDLSGYQIVGGTTDQSFFFQRGSIRADYIFLEDMYYEPKK